MRLLHVETLRIISLVCTDDDFKNATVSRKQVISHAYTEVLKYLATRQIHQKMWLSDFKLGIYLRTVRYFADMIGCNFNEELIEKYREVQTAYNIASRSFSDEYTLEESLEYIHNLKEWMSLDDNYLFSDCTSLYFKGINIFKYVYGDDWRRLVPIENLDEIYRVVGKTIEKRKEK